MSCDAREGMYRAELEEKDSQCNVMIPLRGTPFLKIIKIKNKHSYILCIKIHLDYVRKILSMTL